MRILSHTMRKWRNRFFCHWHCPSINWICFSRKYKYQVQRHSSFIWVYFSCYMATLRFSSILLVCCISICYAHSRYRIWKRDSIFNFGGADNSQNIEGDRNSIFGSTQSPANVGQETLIRKTAHQIGRLLEGGTDVITSPVRWLAHMQENWYVCLWKHLYVHPLWEIESMWHLRVKIYISFFSKYLIIRQILRYYL